MMQASPSWFLRVTCADTPMRQGQHALAAECFSRALGLWHGDPLEDLPAFGSELMGAVAAE